MPYYPDGQVDKASFNNGDYELFSDIALLSHYYHMSHWDVMKLPHSHFLAYIKQAHVQELKKSEEGREYLQKAYRFLNPRKDADLSTIRALTGYISKEKGGNDNVNV
ncbi:MAG: hypothetical protein LPK00_03110 [Bacillaceae bacterium]|nr:hypothetical protein [Bacillaceae bacterium]